MSEETTPILLPHVPSVLIRLALADLKKVEAMPEYTVHMGVWHAWRYGKCSVCLAGSVMAITLEAVNSRSVCPSDFGTHNMAALYSLDDFRVGRAVSGVAELGLDTPVQSREIAPYQQNPAAFHAAMEQLADDFESVGQ